MSKAKIELSATRARETASGYRWTMSVASNSDANDAPPRFTAISSGIFETFAEAINAARLALSEIRNSTEIKTLE